MSIITFIIPVLNEEENVCRVLDSIHRQTYPHDRIEVFFADGGSTDNTIPLIDEWKDNHDIDIHIVHNERKITEFGTAIALKQMKGDYLCLFAADNEIVQDDFLEKAMEAFKIFPDAFGFESHYLKIPNWNNVSNFLTHCMHIDDPLACDIATKPIEVDRKEVNGRTLRKYEARPGYPAGANGFIFKADAIEFARNLDTFEEGQVLLNIELQGDAYIAMIDGYGIYHYYTKGLKQYIQKRAKRAIKFATRKNERATWVDHTGNRIYWVVVYHLTFLLPFAVSVIRALRKREWLWLYYAPVAWSTTAIYVANYVYIRLFGKKAW